MNQLEMTDPEDLLPEDQYLLEVDPEDLAKASSDGRKTWRSNLETALIVAENHKRRREHEADDEDDEQELQSFHFRPPPTDKRCVVSKGQRWRNQIRQKRIMKWKKYNFLGGERTRHDLGDEDEIVTRTHNTAQPQTKPNMKQTRMNSWLISEGSQRYKKRWKK